MTRLIRALADESVLLLGFVAAVLVAVNANEATTKIVMAAVPLALALLVRMVTTKPSTVTKVAYDVTESLSGPSAGAVGTVTKNGEKVIDMVVSRIGGLVGKLAPRAEEVD